LTNEVQEADRHKGRLVVWAALIIIIGIVGGIRYRLINLPLERDEGEFAYMGQLMLQGIPPYAEAYNMKLPGIYAAYALIEGIFGETIQAVHWGLLLVNSGTILLIFFLARRLFDAYSGIVAAGTYGVLSLSPAVLGLAGHATHFVLPPVLGGSILLLQALESNRRKTLFLSGLLFGLGILMKQPALFFAVFAVIYFFWQCRKNTAMNASVLVAGIFLPFVITCLLLSASGLFGRFWFWTVTYARTYGSQIPLEGGVQLFAEKFARIFQSNYLILIAALSGVICSFYKHARSSLPFLVLFFLCSFASVCPGFYFREHYFIPLLPCIALYAGLAVTSVSRLSPSSWKIAAALSMVLFISALGQSIWRYRDLFFTLTPIETCRAMYGSNPFPESIEIADSIKAMTTRQDRIAVVGSEPQIYFYSGRRSATGYIYMYSLMESQPYARVMQEEMTKEIERARPKIVVYINHHTSWLINPASEMFLLRWFNEYVQANYLLVGTIDMISLHNIRHRWHQEVQGYAAQSKNVILVFRRK
jgi:hypothetical protein